MMAEVCLILLFFSLDVLSLASKFGSKTPYTFPEIDFSENDSCSVQGLFLISRHGSRWPTSKHILRYEKLKKTFNHWDHPFDLLDEGLLTPSGENEMRLLGERIRRRFSTVFSKFPKYHPRKYEIRASKSPRALQSAFSFALGMFGPHYAFAIESENIETDNHLRFHDNCPLYKKTKKLAAPNLGHLVEYVTSNVAQRFAGDLNFTASHLRALWSACMFESSALNRSVNSCSYFTIEDAEILEYVQDVYDYWEKAFGQRINYQMSCVLANDIVESLKQQRFRFLFGHAENIMPLTALLQFFRDEQHIGFDLKKDESRKWRSKLISPFCANIAFVSKNCDGRNIIEILHNEKRMDLSHICSYENKWQCPFSEFQSFIYKQVGQCEFNEICSTASEDLRSEL